MADERVDGDVHTVAAATGANTVETVFETPDDATFEMEDLSAVYLEGATTATVVELHDAPDGTGSGALDADTRRYKTELSGATTAADKEQLSGFTFRPFEEDVLVLVDGNQDADYVLTVGGVVKSGAPAAV